MACFWSSLVNVVQDCDGAPEDAFDEWWLYGLTPFSPGSEDPGPGDEHIWGPETSGGSGGPSDWGWTKNIQLIRRYVQRVDRNSDLTILNNVSNTSETQPTIEWYPDSPAQPGATEASPQLNYVADGVWEFDSPGGGIPAGIFIIRADGLVTTITLGYSFVGGYYPAISWEYDAP